MARRPPTVGARSKASSRFVVSTGEVIAQGGRRSSRQTSATRSKTPTRAASDLAKQTPRAKATDVAVESAPPKLARGTRDVAAQAQRALGPATELTALALELKEPLFVILHETATLGEADAVIQPGIERLAHYAAHIDRVLSNVIDLAAADGRELDLRLETCDVALLVVNAIEGAVSARDRRRLTLGELTSLPVKVDTKRIERVLANLVAYTLEHGFEPVTVQLEARAGFARISVRDSGPGISKADAAQIFERFERNRRLTRDLGVYISRKIVEAHQGRVGVETSPQGTLLFIELPLYVSRRASASR